MRPHSNRMISIEAAHEALTVHTAREAISPRRSVYYLDATMRNPVEVFIVSVDGRRKTATYRTPFGTTEHTVSLAGFPVLWRDTRGFMTKRCARTDCPMCM